MSKHVNLGKQGSKVPRFYHIPNPPMSVWGSIKSAFGYGAEPELVRQLSQLASSQEVSRYASEHGLKVQTVAWEDTGRSKGSSWGPNISDMTLVVEGRNSVSGDGTRMPVIRHPNFADKTSDVNIDKFSVTVGNEISKNTSLTRIGLSEYLENFTRYNPNTNVKGTSLKCPRDVQILCSSQACMLPLRDGEVEFSVQLYNYQSYPDDSSCLVIVASSQGTSAQIVTGTQKLFFRVGDNKASFLAKRLKDDRKERGVAVDGVMSSDEQERNCLFIYQIPLKLQKTHPKYRGGAIYCLDDDCGVMIESCVFSASSAPKRSAGGSRGMDSAVLRVGDVSGPWPQITQTLERDPSFPIRCTLQYYNVTDTSTITSNDMAAIAGKLQKIYGASEASGSLVTSGITGRVTEPVLNSTTTSASFNYVVPSNVSSAKPLATFI